MRTHGKRYDSVYRVWIAMIQRCINPKDQAFPRYGGRGITVCERWRKFENFLVDMGEPPGGFQIERKDNDTGYSPENCKWATRMEQVRNKRNNRFLTYKGETLCLAEWAKKKGLSRSVIWHRLDCGWDIERSLNTPARRYR